MADAPLLSVVFSFRNEAPVLPELLGRLAKALGPLALRYELVFVDDASSDGSRDVLAARAADDPRIKVVTMSRRFGQVECAVAGLRAARGDAVILMDADLQDPPEVLPALVDAWRAGADVVHTRRSSRLGEPALKIGFTRLAYRLLSGMANIDLLTDAGDFKLLSRRVVDELLKLPEHDMYLRGLVVWVGFRQTSVTYERQPRFAGRTHFPFFSKNPWRTFLSGFTSFSMTPLMIWLPLGLVVMGAAAIGAIALLAVGGPRVIPAWGWVALGGGAFAGLQMTAIGVLGVYLARMYHDVRGRPQYIVASTIGLDPPAPAPGAHRGQP